MTTGDDIAADVDDAKNTVVGKHNRQSATEVGGEGRSAAGNHPNVTNVDVHGNQPGRYNGEMELLHIRQQVDRTGDRLEDVARRVQQIEIALQINTPNRTSHGERMFMLAVIVASLLMFLINAYIQVVAR